MVPAEQSIKEVLTYNPLTGKLFWKMRVGARGFPGQEAGHFDSHHGYMNVQVKGRGYRSHRVAWLLYYGDWPEGQIDHINGNKVDNRIVNLRDVTQRQNLFNKPPYTKTTSRFKGVSYRADNNTWRAVIQRDGKSVSIGHFLCEREAALAYNYKAENLFGPYARFNEVFDDFGGNEKST